ncbi:MAG: Zn-dependent hydrolase [Actinobacteria bacterium]|nr:Zn-dependent hydrolase [Actinomycetota bacterium]
MSEDLVGRLGERLRTIAAIGADPEGGNTRLAYTEPERAAHDQFIAWAEADGARCETDRAGNTVAVYREGEPYFLLGSHLDTVVRGGAYDGVAGVLGGMEAARLTGDRVSAGVRVVVFAGEEGARFGRPNLGSAAAAGLLDEQSAERLRDAHGTGLAAAAAELGFEPVAMEPWIGEEILCFFELHIEQGRQLEAGSARIGLVDAIAGSVRLRFDLVGRADHSGATPMPMRSDALAAASELILAAEEVGRGYRSTVATVGRIEVHPNNVTTVPGEVKLWMDIRDIDADLQRQAAATVFERARALAKARDVGISGEVVSDQAPVVLEAWPRMIAHRECAKRGLTYQILPSGAGHDAAIVARRAPSTMFFIPCVDGLSHSPREQASVEDIAAAVELMGAVMVEAQKSVAGAVG